MAVVYAARPTSATGDAESDYAIKLLQTAYLNETLARQSLEIEAKVGSEVSHPNLLPVLANHTRRQVPALVMPRIHGATAHDALVACKRFSVPQALWVVRQVAEALVALHEAGWLHGDVKPSNVLLSPTGHCTLFDLGFAAPIDRHTPSVPQSLKGTPAYIAPELLVSRTYVHPASDIYSLGITLFELLTGELPFDVGSKERMVEAHLREIPRSPRHYRPDLSRDVAQLVQQMLTKTPDRRPLAQEVVEQLQRLEIESFCLRANCLSPDPA
jgi:serine/threonine protein kinase